MNIKGLRDEALHEAADVAARKDIYAYTVISGVLRGITTKSVVNGIKYAIWGYGAQMLWNVGARMVVRRIF